MWWAHKRVSATDKKISIATVYRTVKLFEESGILEKHDFKGEGKIWTVSRRASRSLNRY